MTSTCPTCGSWIDSEKPRSKYNHGFCEQCWLSKVCQWQQVNEDYWVFGPVVRGVVREILGYVRREHGVGWSGEPFSAEPEKRINHSMFVAIMACEHALGISDA